MQSSEIQDHIRRIIAEISNVPRDADPHADLYLDLGMASVHALQLLQELEDHFGMPVPDEQFVESTSIAKLTTTVERLLNSHV